MKGKRICDRSDYDPFARLKALGFSDYHIDDLEDRLADIRLDLHYTRIVSDETLRGVRSTPFMYSVLNTKGEDCGL